MKSIQTGAPIGHDQIASGLSVDHIRAMGYVDFISLIRETNRCPGGKASIRYIAQNAFVDRSSQVLEIGSNTGFTSLELARLTKCWVYGIDPAKAAVEEARRELARDDKIVQERVRFGVGSAYQIDFARETFDLVVVGGATSFMDEKQRAVREYYRVLKPWGFLSVTSLFYVAPPPQDVIDTVSNILGITINPWTRQDWLELFIQDDQFELYTQRTDQFSTQTDEKIRAYVAYFLRKPHLNHLSSDVKHVIGEKWLTILRAFNENHRYLGFFTALFRKRLFAEEPELFVSRGQADEK